MSLRSNRYRMDFRIKVLDADDSTRHVTMLLVPDPERYEWREENGHRYLFDKLDLVAIPEDVLADSVKQLKDTPMYYQPHLLGDANTYLQARRSEIEKMLAGEDEPATFQDKSEEFLRSLDVDELGFVILSLDIVDSTKLARATEPRTYARIIAVLLRELSAAVPNFRGHVLKYTGDGLIAYFPEPGFITKNDLAIDCAITLRRLVYEVINPALEARGLPSIDVRIGMDAGEAYVEIIGSPETKQHMDIIGALVSMAAKIEKAAPTGGICLGGTMERNMHTSWRLRCEPVELDDDWPFKGHKVYRVK